MTRTYLAEISNNPADDTFAISAGTGLKLNLNNPGIFIPESYGAIGNDSHDDTTAIQAAINAVKVVGGTLLFDPTKVYKITSPLYLGNNTKTYRISSYGGDAHINISGAVIHLVGNSGGTGNSGGAMQFNDPISGQSAIGIELDHIRFLYDPNVFKGAGTYLVNVAPHADGAGDIQPFDIHHCAFNATNNVNPSNGCQSLVRLHQAIIGSMHHNHFGACQEGIRMGDPSGSYVNVIDVFDNSFNFAQAGHIMIGSADAESITIKSNTFEDMVLGAIVGGSGNSCYNPVIENNWFGDSSVDQADSAWINGLNVTSNNYTGVIAKNRFAGVHTDQYNLNIQGHWVIRENSFEGGKAVFETGSGIGSSAYRCYSNYYNNPLAIFDGPNGHRPPTDFISLGNIVAGVPTDIKNASARIGSEIGFGSQAGGLITNLGTGFEQLVIGVNGSNGAGLLSGAIEALIYTDQESTTKGATELRLQSPGDLDIREVCLIAGTTPLRRVRVNGTGIAFNGTTPIAPPIATTANIIAKLVALGLLDPSSADSSASAPTYAGTILATPNLVSYWPLQEIAGTSAADSKSTNTGTYTGGFTLNQSSTGVQGKVSVLMNGSTGFVSVPDSSNLRIASAITLEAWINSSSIGQGNILGKYNSGTGVCYMIYGNGSTLGFRLNDGTNAQSLSFSATDVPVGVWLHLVAVADGTQQILYMNGVRKTNNAWTHFGPAADASILVIGGAASGTATGSFAGNIQQAAVYNRALTPGEVATHFARGAGY